MDRTDAASKRQRVLVTGAAGLLGTPLCAQLGERPNIDCIALAKIDLDITDRAAAIAAVESHQPDWVINCAAYTKVDDCETNEPLAIAVNGAGAGNIAAAAAKVGAGLIHLSTDYVFDGSARAPIPVDAVTGPPNALSAYGRSKLIGEEQVLEEHLSATIVRTAWVYGPDGPSFPQAILRLAREGKLKRVVNDQRGAPTFAPDLATAIIRLMEAKTTGVVHVTNAGDCTWFEFAQVLLDLAHIDCPIEPCSTADFPRPARRPAYSVLDLSRYEAATGHAMRQLHDAAADYIRARQLT